MATKREIEFVIRAKNEAKAALDSIAVSLSKLDAVQNRTASNTPAMAAALQRLGTASRSAANAAANAEKQITANGLFGLRPHQLTNLQFQLNDIVVGLGSGQKIQTVLLQQGAQIGQIFPEAIGKIARAAVRFIPIMAAVGAVVTIAVVAFQRMTALANDTRAFNAVLAATAGVARTTGAELAQTARRLDDLGLSADDARSALRTFLNEGVDPAQFQRLGLLARDMAQVLGIEVPEAAAKLAVAFGGTFDEVVELDRQFDFLTAAQRRNFQAQADLGDQIGAVNGALDTATSKFSNAREHMVGPWGHALRNFTRLWRELNEAVAPRGRPREVQQEILQQPFTPAPTEAAPVAAPPLISPLTPEQERQLKAFQDALREADEEAAERAEREGQRAAERAAEARADFQQRLSDLEFERSLIGLSAEQQEIRTALRQADLDAQEAGIELSQQELNLLHQQILLLQESRQAAAESNAEMEEHLEAQREALKLAERAAEESARAVDRLNQRIAGGLTDAIEGVITGIKSWKDAFREFAADFLRQIARMIIQQIILNALQTSNPYAAGAAFVAGGVSALHTGGIAGEARPQRRVSPGLFANAIRYHGGGFAGLRPGEVPAVLKRNEEVLAESDPRHAFNAGSQKMPDIKIVNAFDANEAASQMLGTRAGEEGVINIISANRTAVRGIIG